MSAKRHQPAGDGGGALEEALDALYAAPLEQFVVRRRELASKLRADGDPQGARSVGSANKPSRAAWALNQLVRRTPERLQELFDAWDRAAVSQTRGDADQVRATARQYRELISDVANAAGDSLAAEGAEPNAALLKQIAAALQAASGGGTERRAQLLSGRLVKDIDSEDPLAGLAGPSPLAPEKPRDRGRPPPAAEQRSDPEAEKEAERERARELARQREEQKRRVEEARELVRALEAKAHAARAAAAESAAAAKQAESEATRARQASEEAMLRLEAARAELKAVLAAIRA